MIVIAAVAAGIASTAEDAVGAAEVAAAVVDASIAVVAEAIVRLVSGANYPPRNTLRRTLLTSVPASLVSPASLVNWTSPSNPRRPKITRPIILPGESLAKYRDKPPAPPAPVASAGVAEELKTVVPDELSDRRRHTARKFPKCPAREFRSSSLHAVEPLPGESLSKWKRQAEEESSEPQSSSNASFAPPASPEKALHSYENAVNEHEVHPESPEASGHAGMSSHEEREHEAEDSRAQQLHAAEEADEETGSDELSADEAAIVAEHVAEAQIEEEAREAQRHDFASADEAAEAAEVALSGPASAPESELEEEVEDAVADALDEASDENEGPLQTEEESDAEEEGDAEADEHAAEEIAGVEASGSEGNGETGALSASAEGHLEPLEGEQISGGGPAPEGAEAPRPFNARVRGDFRARMQHPRRGGRPDRGRDRGGRRDNRGDRDRGGRPHQGGGHGHGHSHGGHRPQQRRPQLIADMLKQGQEIIVQIAKEPLGKKGARITSHVALPGRYLVYMPTLDHNGISRKFT